MPATTTSTLPHHVAIVMDGNGRWAQKRWLPRVAGHKQGVDALRRTVKSCVERGIKVLCVSEHRKMAPEAIKAYDGVVYVGRNAASETAVAKAPPAAKKDPAPAPATRRATAKKAPAAKKATAKPASAATLIPADQVTKDMILAAFPPLRSGEWLHISDVAKVLHETKLLGKNASSPKLFKRFPQNFELKPESQPNQVRLTDAS